MKTLASRLVDMLGHLAEADIAFSVDSQDDDQARSLGNDVRWLCDRVADRLRIEEAAGPQASPYTPHEKGRIERALSKAERLRAKVAA